MSGSHSEDTATSGPTLDALRRRAAVFASSSFHDPPAVIADAQSILDALDAHPDGPERDAVSALAYGRLATGLRLQGALKRAFEAALRAESFARSSAQDQPRAVAWMVTGHAFHRVGQEREAMRWFQRAAELPGLTPDLAAWIRVNIATALRAAGRLEEADATFDELMALRRAIPDVLRAGLLINAASCWHQVGRVADARAALDEAREALADGERPDLENWVDAIGAWVAVADGDLASAQALAQLVLAPSRPEHIPVRSSAARALAKAALASADPAALDDARRAVEGVLDRASAGPASQPTQELHRSLAGLTERIGDLGAAVRHLREAERLDAELRADDARLSLEHEELRIEFARARAEAEALRTHSEALSRANAALAAAEAARARLMRTLIHDLRGPLMSIMACADLMDPGDPARVRRYTRTLSTAATRMRDLIDDALLSPPDADTSSLDLAALAHESAETFHGLATQRAQRILVEADPGATVVTSPGSAGRILDNLLSNALKFSPRGGTIRIRVTAESGRVDLDVLDEGHGFPGVDPAEGLIFGGQLAGRTAGEGGWGMGLHTVYRLVTDLGGVVALGNRPEGGASVRVSLPRGD